MKKSFIVILICILFSGIIFNINYVRADKTQIEKVLLGEGTCDDKVVKLIRKANNRGGTDNISVAYLIRGKEGDDK